MIIYNNNFTPPPLSLHFSHTLKKEESSINFASSWLHDIDLDMLGMGKFFTRDIRVQLEVHFAAFKRGRIHFDTCT